MNLYPWIRILHVLAVIFFYFTHGVSMAVSFNLASEKNPDRLKALLDVSRSTVMPMSVSLLLVMIFGITMAFMAGWWTHLWPWLALVLLLAMSIWMTYYGRAVYSPIRKALGLPYMTGAGTSNPPVEPAGMDDVQALLARVNPPLLLIVGVVFTLVILWLMFFKPF